MPLIDQPKDTPIPPQLRRWNWGAFFLNWIWGIGNSTYIAFLMFVPGVNLIMLFVLGAKGSQWAWKNQVWRDEDHFVSTQRVWAIVGAAIFAVALALMALLAIGLPKIMKNSGAFTHSMEILRTDPVARKTLGEPIKEGYWIMGSVNLNGNSGTADLSIPVYGPECTGTLHSRADKQLGMWDVFFLVLQTECGRGDIVLRNDRNIRIPTAPSPAKP